MKKMFVDFCVVNKKCLAFLLDFVNDCKAKKIVVMWLVG